MNDELRQLIHATRIGPDDVLVLRLPVDSCELVDAVADQLAEVGLTGRALVVTEDIVGHVVSRAIVEARHYLVVTEPEPGVREYEIEHDRSCPYVGDPPVAADEIPWSGAYGCDVGHVATDGVEYLLDGLDQLVPGRYEIAAWHSHQPSTPNGPEEWDAGLELIPCGHGGWQPGCAWCATHRSAGRG